MITIEKNKEYMSLIQILQSKFEINTNELEEKFNEIEERYKVDIEKTHLLTKAFYNLNKIRTDSIEINIKNN